jgi:ribosomal protein S4
MKVGQTISFRENKLKSKYVEALKQKIKNYQSQEWIESNTKTLTGKVLSIPTPEQFDNKINTQLIVELYSR